MENFPTQPLLAYLIKKGLCWERKNRQGKTAEDILLQQGCPKDVVDSLTVLYIKTQMFISGMIVFVFLYTLRVSHVLCKISV